MNQQERDMTQELELCENPKCKRIFRHKKHGKEYPEDVTTGYSEREVY